MFLLAKMSLGSIGPNMTRVAALLTAVLIALGAPARADDYPSKPIHVLTTSSAGGISDIFMRVLGEELHKSLGQPLIIDNRPGGAGNIAARACQDAPPETWMPGIKPGVTAARYCIAGAVSPNLQQDLGQPVRLVDHHVVAAGHFISAPRRIGLHAR